MTSGEDLMMETDINDSVSIFSEGLILFEKPLNILFHDTVCRVERVIYFMEFKIQSQYDNDAEEDLELYGDFSETYA